MAKPTFKIVPCTERIAACNGCGDMNYIIDTTRPIGDRVAPTPSGTKLFELITESGWATRFCEPCLKHLHQITPPFTQADFSTPVPHGCCPKCGSAQYDKGCTNDECPLSGSFA